MVENLDSTQSQQCVPAYRVLFGIAKGLLWIFQFGTI